MSAFGMLAAVSNAAMPCGPEDVSLSTAPFSRWCLVKTATCWAGRTATGPNSPILAAHVLAGLCTVPDTSAMRAGRASPALYDLVTVPRSTFPSAACSSAPDRLAVCDPGAAAGARGITLPSAAAQEPAAQHVGSATSRIGEQPRPASIRTKASVIRRTACGSRQQLI